MTNVTNTVVCYAWKLFRKEMLEENFYLFNYVPVLHSNEVINVHLTHCDNHLMMS